MHDQIFSLFGPKKNPRCITQARFYEVRSTFNLDMAHVTKHQTGYIDSEGFKARINMG